MEDRIEQLKTATAGRYKIFTEHTDAGLDIVCLDQDYNLVTHRSISSPQLRNTVLLAAIYDDLKNALGCD